MNLGDAILSDLFSLTVSLMRLCDNLYVQYDGPEIFGRFDFSVFTRWIRNHVCGFDEANHTEGSVGKFYLFCSNAFNHKI